MLNVRVGRRRTDRSADPLARRDECRRDGGPPHRGWTLLLASMGVFMAALDALVVATALPVLRIELGATRSDLEWTVNTYNLAFACMILTGAATGLWSISGRKWKGARTSPGPSEAACASKATRPRSSGFGRPRSEG
jgi:hypothetical protein